MKTKHVTFFLLGNNCDTHDADWRVIQFIALSNSHVSLSAALDISWHIQQIALNL